MYVRTPSHVSIPRSSSSPKVVVKPRHCYWESRTSDLVGARWKMQQFQFTKQLSTGRKREPLYHNGQQFAIPRNLGTINPKLLA